jgi:hypothetical protein
VLACAEALADHLIDGGFHKACAEAFPNPVALATVWRVAGGMSLRTRSRLQISALMPCTTIQNRWTQDRIPEGSMGRA